MPVLLILAALPVLAAEAQHHPGSQSAKPHNHSAAQIGEAQPQLAARGSEAVLAYGEDGQIVVRVSSDGGKTFGPASKIVPPAKPMVGRHRGPRAVIFGQTIVVSAIAGGDLWSWRSTDGGKTWLSPSRINDVEQAAKEGLHAMAAGPDFLAATWLDLRTGKMTLSSSISKDGGKSWMPNRTVYTSPDGAICTCCHPSMVADSAGVLTVMFRNDLAGNRDMYWLQSRDRGQSWSKAEQFGKGHWTLNACPMDGGALMLTADGRPLSVWRRGSEIFQAEAGKPEERLGPGKDAAMAGNLVLWTTPEGVVSRKGLVAAGGSYPATVSVPGGVLAAWEAQGKVLTKVISE